MTRDSGKLTIVLYGLPRSAETDAALFADLRAIVKRHVDPPRTVATFKYNQRPDCIAHGGVLYVDGGRKV